MDEKISKSVGLQREVAQVASQLGFRPRAPLDNIVETVPSPATQRIVDGLDKKTKDIKKDPKQKNRKQKWVSGKISKRKGNKTDAYDKKALLEILSGPDETMVGKMKELRRVKSILPKNIPPLWHDALESLGSLVEETTAPALTEHQREEKKAEASRLLQNEKEAFEYRMYSSRKKGRWFMQVRSQGTHVDRIAAASLLIRDSVVANLGELDFLLSLAEKQKGSRELVLHALKSLAELFKCYLLPDRKLSFFEQQPFHLLKKGEDKEKLYLLLWWVEDCLKRKYVRLLTALAAATTAPLDHLRTESITLVSDLIYDKPEQEANLLSIFINKLGDKSRKIGTKVAFLISKLLDKHTRMKLVVFKEAEKLVFAPGTTIRSVQCVLQIFKRLHYKATEGDIETATKYIDMCFTLFQQLVNGRIGSEADLRKKAENKALAVPLKKRKQPKRAHIKKKSKSGTAREIDATVLSSVVSGIKTLLPHADHSKLNALLDKHLNSLFRLMHIAPFGVGVQIIALLCEILPAKETSLDRLYRAIYEKILDPGLPQSRKLPLFMSTVFTMIKDDPDLSRSMAVVKRLLQIAPNSEPPLYCAFIMTISEAIRFKPGLRGAITQPEEEECIDGKNLGKNDRNLVESSQNRSAVYKIDYREPRYSGAQGACLWELCFSLNHYHPVTHSMGQSLLAGEATVFTRDPFQELSLSAFLDKFVNGKDAKLRANYDSRVSRIPGASIRPKSDTFLMLADKDIPVEDAFFHKYFNLQTVRNAKEVRQTSKAKRKAKHLKNEDTVFGDPDAEDFDSIDMESVESPEMNEDVDMSEEDFDVLM